jgi:hypothetical protein
MLKEAEEGNMVMVNLPYGGSEFLDVTKTTKSKVYTECGYSFNRKGDVIDNPSGEHVYAQLCGESTAQMVRENRKKRQKSS